MAKISMLEASKLFNVSRPTLTKHLQHGKITGEKVTIDKNTFWKLDPSELARVYEPRVAAAPDFPPALTIANTPPDAALQAEIKLLQAKLDAANVLAEERLKHLDDLRRLLARPQEAAPKRGWWPW